MNILEEAQRVVEKTDCRQMCEQCAWNQFCVEPPEMTEEEVNKELRKTPVELTKEEAMSFQLISALAFAGKDKTCRACPVFIQRLQEGPQLSQEIKRIMQEWED